MSRTMLVRTFAKYCTVLQITLHTSTSQHQTETTQSNTVLSILYHKKTDKTVLHRDLDIALHKKELS